jgi:hypothetical protein
VASGEDRGGYRPADDTERRRACEKADRELIEAERSIEEVQIERRDAEPEAAQRGGREVEDGVAPSQGQGPRG